MAINFEAIQKRALSVRELYASSANNYSNILAYGDFGTGKSRLALTCPTPVFIDSFDPGGTKTAALQPLIESGDIIVENRWEKDSWKQPFAFYEWEREMGERQKENFFEAIGTYVLDSITKWSDSMLYEILKRGTRGKSRMGTQPELQDYLMQQMTAIDWMGVLMGLPCNILVTGHIGLMKDEVSGAMHTGLLLAGKLSEKVPLVFDEKYVTRIREAASGVSYVLQTKNDGYYKAETRIGGLKFDTFEEPDIRKLLTKAGKSPANKPRLFPEEVR